VQCPIISCANPAELHGRCEVGNLKYKGQRPAQDNMEEEERRHCPPDRKDHEWRQDKEPKI